MESIKKCKYCKRNYSEYSCDKCGKELQVIAVEIIFGYGSKKDGEILHFCSDECLYDYIKPGL